MTSTRSAAGSGLPKERVHNPDLESELVDAANMADVTYGYLARSGGFENSEPPRISAREAELVYWAVCQTAHMVRVAKEAYYAQHGEGRS